MTFSNRVGSQNNFGPFRNSSSNIFNPEDLNSYKQWSTEQNVQSPAPSPKRDTELSLPSAVNTINSIIPPIRNHGPAIPFLDLLTKGSTTLEQSTGNQLNPGWSVTGGPREIDENQQTVSLGSGSLNLNNRNLVSGTNTTFGFNLPGRGADLTFQKPGGFYQLSAGMGPSGNDPYFGFNFGIGGNQNTNESLPGTVLFNNVSVPLAGSTENVIIPSLQETLNPSARAAQTQPSKPSKAREFVDKYLKENFNGISRSGLIEGVVVPY